MNVGAVNGAGDEHTGQLSAIHLFSTHNLGAGFTKT